jgi:hypothetical protein
MASVLIRPYYDIFKSMQETLDQFAEIIPLGRKKLQSFDKIVALWGSQMVVGKATSTVKRYKYSRSVLVHLFKIGLDSFFLVTLSVSTTTIGMIKDKTAFCEAVTNG